MEYNQDVITREERAKAFQDIDLSNWYEFGVFLLQSIIANIILYLILQKIRQLFIWQKDDQQNDPSKMLKVNLLLIFVLLFKIFSFYYAIAGFLFSEMWKWNCEDNTPMTINPRIYVASQIVEAQLLNMTFIYCSKLWLKLWRLKLSMEQKSNCLNITSKLQYLVVGLLFFIPILTIISLLSIFQIFDTQNFERLVLGSLTLICGILFICINVILYKKLKDFYNVGEKYTKTLKHLFICLILCALIRPFFNLLLLDIDWIIGGLKPGCQEENRVFLPDTSTRWYQIKQIRAWFSLFYVPITDFLPIFIISKLFSPNVEKRKTLVKISSGWDTGFE